MCGGSVSIQSASRLRRPARERVFADRFDRARGLFKRVRGQPMADRFVALAAALVVRSGPAMPLAQPHRVAGPLRQQEIVEEVVVAVALARFRARLFAACGVFVAQRDDEEVETAKVVEGLPAGARTGVTPHRIAGRWGEFPEHGGVSQKAGDLGRLAVEQLAGQVFEERGGRADAAGEQVEDAFRRAAAQPLPRQLEGDRPAFGLVIKQHHFVGREAHAVNFVEQLGCLVEAKGQVGPGDLEGLAAGAPGRERGETRGVAGREDRVQVGRQVGHEALDERVDLGRRCGKVVVVQDEQGGGVQADRKRVDERVDHLRGLHRAAIAEFAKQCEGRLGQSGQPQPERADQVEQELLRVAVRLVQRVPEEMGRILLQPGQRGRLAVAGARLDDREPAVEGFPQAGEQLRPREDASMRSRRSEAGAQEQIVTQHGCS